MKLQHLPKVRLSQLAIRPQVLISKGRHRGRKQKYPGALRISIIPMKTPEKSITRRMILLEMGRMDVRHLQRSKQINQRLVMMPAYLHHRRAQIYRRHRSLMSLKMAIG
jgi:hypothetical protein